MSVASKNAGIYNENQKDGPGGLRTLHTCCRFVTKKTPLMTFLIHTFKHSLEALAKPRESSGYLYDRRCALQLALFKLPLPERQRFRGFSSCAVRVSEADFR